MDNITHSGQRTSHRLLLSACALAASLAFVAGQGVASSTTPRGNFATLDAAQAAGKACPGGVPLWDYPRRDLPGMAP